jgi:hypothetical protein
MIPNYNILMDNEEGNGMSRVKARRQKRNVGHIGPLNDILPPLTRNFLSSLFSFTHLLVSFFWNVWVLQHLPLVLLTPVGYPEEEDRSGRA